MLVRVHNSADTHAEHVLIDWLRTWKEPSDPHGVATVNCSLFHNDRLHPFDAVIWTPTTCVIIEAETLVDRVEGDLEIPLNGPWRIADRAVLLERGDKHTPSDTSREHTFALQTWIAERGLGQRAVLGVVVVVPPHGTRVQIKQLWSDPSFHVILGDDPRPLRDFFASLESHGKPQWSANDVALAFRGLGILPYLPAPQDLVNEGFVGPVDITLWHGGPQQAQAEAYAEELAQLEREVHRAGPITIATPWFSPWRLYPKETGDIDLGRIVARTILTLGMIVAVAWVLWFILVVVFTCGR